MAKELRYPVYVISKGRPSSCITVRSLRKCNVPFKVVVEPSEVDAYRRNQWVGSDVLVLPLDFSERGCGSIPVRNWVWNHSLARGDERHWILDDNIEDFNRLNKNTKFRVRTNATFRACEDFTDRFSNVGLSGMNYYSFAKATDPVPPFYTNTRIYSCILVNNSLEFRWRGRFNEDTDLSLRVLKSGLCTILFNAFLCGKVTTMRMDGGNTNDLYEKTNDRKEFAESLAEQHPDVVRVTRKFNRWHHQVDYSSFKENKLTRSEGVSVGSGIDNYEMVLVDRGKHYKEVM